MPSHLPDSIAAFFAVSNGADTALLRECFTPDAVLNDENQRYPGHDAIQAWSEAARARYQYRVELRDCSVAADELLAVACVTGDFPGSPVQLNYAFRLRADKIVALEISL